MITKLQTPQEYAAQSSRTVPNKRPFFKKWLQDNDVYDTALTCKGKESYSTINDLFVCWIYGRIHTDKFAVGSCHDMYTTELYLADCVDTEFEKDSFWLRKHFRFKFYKCLKDAIRDGSFFKLDYREKEVYDRIMNGQEAFASAKEYQLNI